METMADVGEWLGGKPPGGVNPFSMRGRQIGWRFLIQGATAKKLPRDVCEKRFSFKKFGDGAEAAAKAHQRQIAENHGLLIKNQYRYREDPRDGLPYIEFHIRDTAGKDHYPMCDATEADLSLLKEHTWYIDKNGNNIYVATTVRNNRNRTIKYFHSFKCPDWPMVDHYSEIPKENRNGLDNRNKHLRDGSGGVNRDNCRRRKDNTSDVNGVDYANTKKAWQVRIQHKGVRSPPKYFYGPKDKTHPSYHEACAYAQEQAARVGNTHGQMPEDKADSDIEAEKEAMAVYMTTLGM